jgi:hypothetical protein
MMKILTLLLALCCTSVPALAQVISPAPTQFNTWTPAVTTDGTDATGATYTVQQGSYVITGSLVVTWFEITIPESGWAGTPTGHVVLEGLPVANNAIDNGLCYLAVVPGFSGAGNVVLAPSATSGVMFNVSASAGFDVSEVLTVLNSGPWAISGICWYHF